MGATTFSTEANGETAQAAFNSAVKSAQYEYGHAGYTGTIAEKRSFVMILDTIESVIAMYNEQDGSNAHTLRRLLAGERDAIANALIELDDARISDKWGDAGCIDLGLAPDGKTHCWLFFGWSPE